MTTKHILSIAIIALLPFTANAGYTYTTAGSPAQVAADGDVSVAPSGPYVTSTITDAEKSQIASTAYVKGAYNDAIRAVNKVRKDVDDIVDDIEEHTAMAFENLRMAMGNGKVDVYTDWNNGETKTAKNIIY